jgi:hypothetical protein
LNHLFDDFVLPAEKDTRCSPFIYFQRALALPGKFVPYPAIAESRVLSHSGKAVLHTSLPKLPAKDFFSVSRISDRA